MPSCPLKTVTLTIVYVGSAAYFLRGAPPPPPPPPRTQKHMRVISLEDRFLFHIDC